LVGISKTPIMENYNTAESPSVDFENVPPEAPINASGHTQQLSRNFGLLSTCGLALTAGNTWLALGGSVVCPPLLQ